MDCFKGALKSKIAWLGVFITALPDLWPLIQDDVLGLSGDYKDIVVRLAGIAVVITRFFTDKSLVEKA